MVSVGKYFNIPFMDPVRLNFFWKFEMKKNAEMDNGCDESASNTASVFCVQVLKMRQYFSKLKIG